MTVELHQVLLGHVTAMLNPITSVRSAEDLRHRLAAVGWDLDGLAGFDVDALIGALRLSGDAASEVVKLLNDNGPADLGGYVHAASRLAAAAQDVFAVVVGWQPSAGLDPSAAELLASDLASWLLHGYIGITAPRLAAVLELAGVVRREKGSELSRTDGTVVRAAMDREVVDLGELAAVLTNPVGALTRRFRDDPATGRRAAEMIADLTGPQLAAGLQAFGVVAGYGMPGPGRGLALTPDELAAARRLLIVETPPDSDSPLQESFRLVAGLTDDTAGQGLGLVLAPSGELTLELGDLAIRVAGAPDPLLVTGSGVQFTGAGQRLVLSIAYQRAPADGAPVLRFGSPQGTRFQIAAVRVSTGVDLGGGAPDWNATVELNGVELAIAAGDGDGFLNKILPAEPLSTTADLAADWSLRQGFRFRGLARFEAVLPVRIALGPVQVSRATVAVEIQDDALSAMVTVTAAASLGPFAASVEGIGLRALLRPGVPGEAVAIEFKPPDGVGLVIDAPGVTGGGYLLCDHVRQEYAGIIQLEFAGLALSAIGLITTRPGEFSLLVIISAEFSPIQLGYGFTLNGVGGLLGVNRTIAVEAIQQGLKQGALDAILFPRDPVRNAPALVVALNQFFPPTQGQYVFGPSVILGWGTPTILTITLGVLIELPSPQRIVLAGQLRMVLPDEKTQIAVINVDLLGSLDLANNRLEIDASLRDSRVAGFTIAGDMALRASWGSEPGFLMSAGGFNPGFKPPGRLRRLERLSISVSTGDNPRLRLEAYLALTSNTVQFGARLDLYAAADIVLGRFSVAATIGFDALIQFSPFSFVVHIYASIVLKWNDDPFLGVSLDFTLSGPEPWRACGEATFHFLGTHTIQFELTVGKQPPPQPPELVDVLHLLSRALLDPRNWEAQYPADSRRTIVTLRPQPVHDNGLVVHPLGSLTVRQQVVPLQREITRFGAGRPGDQTRFDLALEGADGSIREPDVVLEDPFARAQFLDLSDAERLAAPSFDLMPSGAAFSGGGLRLPTTGIHEVVTLEYDERRLDVEATVPDPTSLSATHVLAEADLLRMVHAGAAARNGAAGTDAALLIGKPVEIGTRPLTYQVVALNAMVPMGDDAKEGTSYSLAAEGLRLQLAERPELAGQLAVVGVHEVRK